MNAFHHGNVENTSSFSSLLGLAVSSPPSVSGPYAAFVCSFSRIQGRKHNCGCPILEPKRIRSAEASEMLFQNRESMDSKAGAVPCSQECWVQNQLRATSPCHIYSVVLCKLESLFPGTSGRTSWTRVSLLINLGS